MEWLNLIPVQYVPYVTAVVTVCSVLAAIIPAPTSGPLVPIWAALNYVAMNFGNAKNITK